MASRCSGDFEPGGGADPPGRQGEPSASEGCAYCRAPEPVLCEGFCVHCGTEVSAARTITATALAAPSGELTYTETLWVSWLLLWRGLSIVALIGGLVLWTSESGGGLSVRPGILLTFAATSLLGLFVVVPWLVRSMLKKRFRGFSLVVAREQEGTGSQ